MRYKVNAVTRYFQVLCFQKDNVHNFQGRTLEVGRTPEVLLIPTHQMIGASSQFVGENRCDRIPHKWLSMPRLVQSIEDVRSRTLPSKRLLL